MFEKECAVSAALPRPGGEKRLKTKSYSARIIQFDCVVYLLNRCRSRTFFDEEISLTICGVE